MGEFKDGTSLTLDDFYTVCVEPQALHRGTVGDAARAMLKARDETKAGHMTPARARELAYEAVPEELLI